MDACSQDGIRPDWPVRLRPADIEAIAQRVAQLIRSTPAHADRYVDAATLARLLGVERNWVYAHAGELGAIRLGGPHGRLRFDRQKVTGELAARQAARSGPQVRRSRTTRRRGQHTREDLIPYESAKAGSRSIRKAHDGRSRGA